MLSAKSMLRALLLALILGLVVACGGSEPAAPEVAEEVEEPAAEEEAAEEAAEEEAAEEEAMEEEMAEDPLGNIVIAAGEPIRVASALVISGPNETLGIDSQRGVEIAISDRGAVMGREVELVAEDGACSAEGGQTAATKIASDDSIVAVVGHNCSSSCTPAAPIYNDAGVTMISPSCTAPALTGDGSHVDSFLRTAHNDNIQGRVMAEFVFNELGLTTAATIHDGSPYAEQLQQVFADVFVELGGTITAQEAINVGDTDMRPVLTSIATGSPEFLYYPIFIAEGGFVTTQSKEIAGLEETILAGADGMISPDFIDAAGDAAEGMYISGPDLAFTGGKYEAFLASHDAAYGEAPLSAFHAHAYDAANMIFDAIEMVGVEDGDGNLVIGRQALRDALYGTSGFDGITGNLNCGDNGDCADPKIAVNQIQGGAYVPVAAGGDDAMMEEEAMDEMAVDGLLAEIMDRGVIRVSTDPNYAPQSFLKPDGSFEGFDIDVATEIANRLGVEIEFVTPAWDAITAGNWSDQWDVSVGSMTVTTPRAEALNFTSGYYFTPAQYAAAAGAGIESLDDIAGQAVCAGVSTTYETYLSGADIGIPSEFINVAPPEGVTVVALPTDAECAQSIQAGRDEFSVFLTSATVVDEAIANGVDVVKVGEPVFVENLAAAFDKNSSMDTTSAVAAVSKIIEEMHADGTLTDLSMQWFGVDLTTISSDDAMMEEAMAEEKPKAELAAAGITDNGGLLTLSAGSCDYGGKIGQITAVDSLTVEFTMCKPDPAFEAKAAFTPFGIQPSEHLEATGGTGELLENPIGTGPFMVETWNRGDSIIYTRFDDYWGEPAIVETFVLRWATEGAARLLELQSGTVDQITNVSPDDFETVASDDSLQLLPVANPNTLYLAMTNTFAPFDDINVRKAIAMGIDRQRIIDNFFPDGSEVASHFTPCSIPNGCQGESWYEFDPEGARDMLAEAGYADGFETAIYYRDVFRGYLPEPGIVAVEFQTQLRDNLGIEAEVVVMESGEFIAESTAGNLDGFYLLGWGADYPHVTNFLDFHFSASNPQFGDPHPEIYEVLEAASQVADVAEAAPLYEQANNAIKELVPMVPIAHGASAQAASGEIVTNSPPFGGVRAEFVDPGKDTFVFMQNAEPISLYCGDETDGESLLACQQVTEPLLQYALDSGDVLPGLATECNANADATVWTCALRDGVTFHDGSEFDANDVVVSWAAGIDAANPLHVGNTGAYEYYSYLWDGLMNAE